MSQFLFITPEQHFSEAVKEACENRKIKTFPLLNTYLIHLLKHYLDSKNLFSSVEIDSSKQPPQTMAEIYMLAMSLESPRNKEVMKTLADRTLYLSGFFGDSLQRKIIDLDYYKDIGSAAYSNLAVWSKEDTVAAVYKTFSNRFFDFVEVLHYISEKSSVQSDQNALRLYERYIKTGSEAAREKLNQMGIVTVPKEQLKVNKA